MIRSDAAEPMRPTTRAGPVSSACLVLLGPGGLEGLRGAGPVSSACLVLLGPGGLEGLRGAGASKDHEDLKVPR